MSEKGIGGKPVVFVDSWTARYEYAVGEVAGKFMDGLKRKKILATSCSKSGLTYLPPRAYCERSFEKCDGWVEAGLEGVLEVATVTTIGFQGSPEPPYAVAYVRLDGVDTAVGGYVRGLDLGDVEAAMDRLRMGTRMRVEFIDQPQGRVTDFYFVPA
ncbi:MAG: OB-fold domain-containing protein [Proteobacteria bacterium]|nr:OB-fold domain-containing protein [Pseudomonadota bacterium]